MKREEILKNKKLIKRFCKDNNLPINVYEEPYFTQRLAILDEIFDCEFAFRTFVKELEAFENEQEYFEHYNAVKDAVITHIKSHPKFQEFNEMKTDYPKPAYGSRDFYKMPLNEKHIISIDMKKANFTALSRFSKDIFLGADTWEEFMGKFTGLQNLIRSKYVRQVIMGACNPKRQVAYEKYLMTMLLEEILPKLEGLEVYSLSNDEIILVPDTETKEFSFDVFEEVTKAVKETEYADMVRVSVFHLEKLPVTDGWKREIYYDRASYDSPELRKHYHHPYDFKKLSADYYHQIVKAYRNEHITGDDLVIYHDGRLARLLNPIL